LLPFGGFFVDFDLAGLKMHPGAGIPQQNFLSSDAFCISNCRKLQRKSTDFHSSDAFCISNCCKFVSCGGSQLISIPPMQFVFQTAIRCGGSQLMELGTRVANLGDFPLKMQI
jgi:hypothetical protein